MQVRSPSAATAATGSTVLRTAADFAGQRRLLHLQALDLEQPQVGRHLVAGLDEDDVARHQPFGGDGLAMAVAQHAGLQRQHLADGIERPLGLALLDEADQRVDDDDAGDDRRIDVVLHQGGDRRRDEQDVDQDVVELEQQPDQRAATLRRPQPVGAVDLQALPSRLGGEAGAAGLQRRQHVVGRHGVPGVCRIGLSMVGEGQAASASSRSSTLMTIARHQVPLLPARGSGRSWSAYAAVKRGLGPLVLRAALAGINERGKKRAHQSVQEKMSQ